MNADKIRKFREQKTLTQQQLADLLGVTPTAVTTWERGQSPSGPALKLLHFLIDGVHPFSGTSSGEHGANWDLNFSLPEWKELERRRVLHGFATVEDYLAWVIKQHLHSSPPPSKTSLRGGARKKK